jgi:hypothetical protein
MRATRLWANAPEKPLCWRQLSIGIGGTTTSVQLTDPLYTISCLTDAMYVLRPTVGCRGRRRSVACEEIATPFQFQIPFLTLFCEFENGISIEWNPILPPFANTNREERSGINKCRSRSLNLAPRARFELATLRLTAISGALGWNWTTLEVIVNAELRTLFGKPIQTHLSRWSLQ